MKREKGITLIALIVTIIILIILATVSINLIWNDNGILERAKNGAEEYKKASVEEKVKLILGEYSIESATGTKTIEEYLNEQKEKGEFDEVTNNEDGTFTIEIEQYEIIIEEDTLKIISTEKLGRIRPTIDNVKVTLEDETEVENYSQTTGTPLVIDFEANIEGGEITSIVPNIPYTTDGIEQQIPFKISGIVNGEEYSRTIKVYVSDKYIKSYESLQKAISEISEDGEQKIQIATPDETVLHGIDTIVYNGDLVLDGINSVKGATLEDNVYEFGDNTIDVATETENAKNTVILKVNGNLTINEGVTLTTCKSDKGYGGPKGLIIYCTKILTNHGKISMTERGAKADGQNVYLMKNEDNSYEFIPKKGAVGGNGAYISKAYENTLYGKGNAGENAINRETGGGGSGAAIARAMDSYYSSASSDKGGEGHSYSGGIGKGSKKNTVKFDRTTQKVVSIVEKGNDMTKAGGLLIIYTKELNNSGEITSKGTNSDGLCGASGGGSINIFYNKLVEQGEMSVFGGNEGTYGGKGGNGSITLQKAYITL